MLTGVNKPVDFLITVLADELVSIGFLTDEPLMNDMCGLGVTQTGKGSWLLNPTKSLRLLNQLNFTMLSQNQALPNLLDPRSVSELA